MTKNRSTSSHTPVLLSETLKALDVQPGGRYIDCNARRRGHRRRHPRPGLPRRAAARHRRRPQRRGDRQEKLAANRSDVLLVNDNFTNLQSICIKYDFFPCTAFSSTWGFLPPSWRSAAAGSASSRTSLWTCVSTPARRPPPPTIVNNSSEVRLGISSRPTARRSTATGSPARS